MPTTDDLRTAMNDLAAGTESLPTATLLRAGRRHRTRRRLVAGAGAAAAVLAVVAAVSLVPWRPDGTNAPVAAGPSAAATSASPAVAVLTREQRFAFGPEQETEKNVFTTVITDRQLPPDATDEAQLDLIRIPGESKVPPPGDDPDTDIRTITVAATAVRVSESPADVGLHQQLEWIASNARYVLVVSPYATDAGKLYGASEDDLRWLVERTIRR